MGRLSITFFFTVRLHVLYGMLISVVLGCHGSCLVVWRVCLLVGRQEVVLEVLLCGKWFLFATCDAYGKKEMRDSLRDPWRSSRPSSSILSSLGQ
jgi:hypothetical protein